LAAFFLLALVAGFMATRPLISAKAKPPVYSASTEKAEFDDGWRRTADGWEHVSSWEKPAEGNLVSGIQQIHPLVGAALLALVSIGVLIAGGASREASPDDEPATISGPCR